MQWRNLKHFVVGGTPWTSSLSALGKGIAILGSLGIFSVGLASSCATQVVPPGPGEGEGPGLICLLHNCNTDAECTGCSLARSRCLPSTHQCVACDSETATGCVIGERCSEWGVCVPEGLECPTDDRGEPTVACALDTDCAACDPQHRVCDVLQGSCVGCTSENTSECPATDYCFESQCVARCPSVCTNDGECAQCGSEGHEAKACNAHSCAECSPTYPCPNGMMCTPSGACVTQCGSDGAGACATDTDCAGCAGGAVKCHLPASGPGTCGPEAATCDQLVSSGMALPEPWGASTQQCMADAGCAAAMANLNVGKLLRDMTGLADIKDAAMPYGMNKCADVTIGSGNMPLTCGICVPCKADTDCKDIDVEPVAEQLFGPAADPKSAQLSAQVFGNKARVVQMFCDVSSGSYGVCAACPGVTSDCGTNGGSGGGSGMCDHDVCTVGGPLDPSCDMCTQAVCGADSFCCNNTWDSICVLEVGTYCGMACGAVGCAHDECAVGDKLDANCSMCAGAVCAADAYCCNTSWDVTCVSEVAMYCQGKDCGPLTCMTPLDCPWPLGCTPAGECGPCTTDADCTPDKCDTFSGECYVQQ